MTLQIDGTRVIERLNDYTRRVVESNIHPDYSKLQLTWNIPIIKHVLKWIPPERDHLMGIGSFLGLLEFSFAEYFDRVTCVDHESFLPGFKPKNVHFHQVNLDSGSWKMPDGLVDMCFMIETIEHLLWSPVPMLKWIHQNARILVISTPDNDEWPAMLPKAWIRYQHFREIPSASPGLAGNPEPMNHCKQYGQSEFIELLDFCGFRLLEFQRIGEGGHQMLAICAPRLKQ
jgi:hypothetical protein